MNNVQVYIKMIDLTKDRFYLNQAVNDVLIKLKDKKPISIHCVYELFQSIIQYEEKKLFLEFLSENGIHCLKDQLDPIKRYEWSDLYGSCDLPYHS